jgi:uncharacterized repeat protein (TIGR02543 family)
MKNTIKVLNIFALAVTIALLGGCFSPWTGGDATITIHVGEGSERAAFPPDSETLARISHMVDILGPSTMTGVPLAPGTQTLNLSVIPGSYTITVRAYLDGKLYAKCTATAEARAGQSTRVDILMQDAREEFTVTFNSNGGDGDVPQSIQADAGGGITVPGKGGLSKGGYVFGGWCEDRDGAGIIYYEGDDFTVTDDITLYAVWIAAGEAVIVTFNSNGGSSVDPRTTTSGGTIMPPADPTRGGHVFGGWYLSTDENFTKPYDFTKPITDNITLCAKWDDPYFTTIDAFKVWLARQSTNSKEIPYDVTLTVDDLGVLTANSVGNALKTNPDKYVNLNLSGSTFTTIVANAFQVCSTLTGITLPAITTIIDDYAFSDCANLTGVTIPDTVITIGEYAFHFCTSLTEITIPRSVNSIGQCAFAPCNNLTTVTFATGSNIVNANFGGSAFPQGYTEDGNSISGDKLKNFYILQTGGAGTYIREKNGANWMKWNGITYTDIAAFKDWLDAQGENHATETVYYVKMNVNNIIVPISLGDTLRANPNKYVYLDLSGSTIEEIPEWAFMDNNVGCATLVGITIPDSVKSIGECAFCYCFGLISITIPNSVTSIGVSAFAETGLTSIIIPNSVTIIENTAFQDCANLTSVTFQGTIASSGFYPNAFDGDLRAKYLDSGKGGIGTYTRSGTTWTKE